MSITGAIVNANSGLAAAQRRADVVSNNIANALTPGYARRDLSVSEHGAGGVKVDGVVRTTDPVLTRERRVADGLAARDQAVASAYASLNASLGEPDDPFSLVGQYSNLEAALRALGESPESMPQQAQTLDAARAVATTLNRLSDETQQTRENADASIAKAVERVNAALKQIERLNGDIAKAAAGGRDIAALEDQRKQLIDEVAEIIPVREIQRERSAVDLITEEGVFLIAGSAREIEFTPSSIITPDLSYNGGLGALSGLTVDGINITPGGGSQSIRNGSMAGLFATRDDIAPKFQAQLDGLARDLIERFSGIDATLAPGEPGLFTDAGGAFDPLTEQGLASRLAVNTAVDPDAGGALWRLRDGLGAVTQGPAGADGFIRTMLDSFTEKLAAPAGVALAGVHSATEAAAGVNSSIGSARVAAEARLAGSNARAVAVAEAELAVTGVDTDAEMQKLLLVEQAFAANARVIQAAKDMIERLMEL